METHYVYELFNLLGTVEYVGETNNTHKRFINHKCKNGKFHKRQDISMNIVTQFDTKKEAFLYQVELQKEYGLETDLDYCSKGGKASWLKNKDSGQIKRVGDIWGIISASIEHTCPVCNHKGRGPNMFRFHFKRCKRNN